MKASEEYSIPKQGEFLLRMLEESSGRHVEKRKPPAEPNDADLARGMSESVRAIKMARAKSYHEQQPSTLATLNRTDAEQEAWLNRPLPTKDQWQADKDYVRPMSPEEIELHRASQHSRNNIGKDSSEEGPSPARKEAAAHAFTYSPGIKAADLSPEDKERLMKMSGYTPPPAPVVEEKQSFWGRLFGKKQKKELKTWKVATDTFRIIHRERDGE